MLILPPKRHRLPLVGAALLALATVAPTPGRAQGAPASTPPSIEALLRKPAVAGLRISPAGKRVALLVQGEDGRRKAAVLDLATLGSPRIVGGFANADVQQLWWTTDDRLIYGGAVEDSGRELAAGEAGLFAVNHDGSEPRQLTTLDVVSQRERMLPYSWHVLDVTRDGSGDLLVGDHRVDTRGELVEVVPARLNTRTGELTRLPPGAPSGMHRWIFDAKGRAVGAQALRQGRAVVWARQPDGTWTKLADEDALEGRGLQPWFVEADGKWLVLARRDRNEVALWSFDPAAGRFDGEPVLALKGYDVDPEPVLDATGREVIGLQLAADRPMTVWFDPRLQALQKQIDLALPGRSNQLRCQDCLNAPSVVVSTSDRMPAEYHRLDPKTGKLVRIGLAAPWLEGAALASVQMHRLPARDGLELPVYVATPAGRRTDEPLPTVLLVHGGPWVRGYGVGWNPEAQFLAAQGYRVLMPEPRASTGYGWKLFRAGWKNWGTSMQHDLIDVVDWGVREKLVDPARACIMGASYGGYAALMAPIVSPKTFRCAVSAVGVTDPRLLYEAHWSDANDSTRKYGLPTMLGSPSADGALLDAASPLKRAAELTIPVLMMHGAADRRVPLDHGKQFVAAAKAAGKSVEAHVYAGEGHGLRNEANRLDWWRRTADFLASHLKPAAAAAPSAR